MQSSDPEPIPKPKCDTCKYKNMKCNASQDRGRQMITGRCDNCSKEETSPSSDGGDMGFVNYCPECKALFRKLRKADREREKAEEDSKAEGDPEAAKGYLEAAKGDPEAAKGYLKAAKEDLEAAKEDLEAAKGYLEAAKGDPEVVKGYLEADDDLEAAKGHSEIERHSELKRDPETVEGESEWSISPWEYSGQERHSELERDTELDGDTEVEGDSELEEDSEAEGIQRGKKRPRR